MLVNLVDIMDSVGHLVVHPVQPVHNVRSVHRLIDFMPRR